MKLYVEIDHMYQAFDPSVFFSIYKMQIRPQNNGVSSKVNSAPV